MRKIIKGFMYAFNGLSYTAASQINFRIHLVISVVVIGLGYVLCISVFEWMWIVLCMAIVLMLELINTALETLIDLISPQHNVKAGIVKDVAAAAVLLGALFSVIIGLFIFLPKICALL